MSELTDEYCRGYLDAFYDLYDELTYSVFHRTYPFLADYNCNYCNDSGVNYKVDGTVVKCGRCFHSPVEVYIDSKDMSICLLK